MRASEMSRLLSEEIAPLRRFALLLTRSFEDAQDLSQDTMERALVKAHLFDGANLRAWLFTMCRRIFLNKLRKEKTAGVSVEIDDAPAMALGVKANQEAAAELSRVARCMDRLSARDRSLLSLVALGGARYEEAASILRTPVGTVRSRLSRARGRLKSLIETPDHCIS